MPDQKLSKPPLCLSIVGQTASGKTAQALQRAETWLQENPGRSVCILSADSKQVFQELPLLTGADIPSFYTLVSDPGIPYPFFQHPSLSLQIHAVSCIPGNSEWSVGHFYRLIASLVHKQPDAFYILVGGTGLYHQQVFQPAETLLLSPDQTLRKTLEQLSLSELQEHLQQKNITKWQSMNHSDQQNPRRLIRALEVESMKRKTLASFSPPLLTLSEQIGLTTHNLEEKIKNRVLKRLEQGVLQEVQNFEKRYPEPKLMAKTALGYQEILQFLQGSINQETLVSLWATAEIQYSKRQMTWWKKQPGIHWKE